MKEAEGVSINPRQDVSHGDQIKSQGKSKNQSEIKSSKKAQGRGKSKSRKEVSIQASQKC